MCRQCADGRRYRRESHPTRKVLLRESRRAQFPAVYRYSGRATAKRQRLSQLARAVRGRRGDKRQWKWRWGDVHWRRATCRAFRWWWFFRSLAGRRSSRRRAGAKNTKAWRVCREDSAIHREQFLRFAGREKVAAILPSRRLWRECWLG